MVNCYVEPDMVHTVLEKAAEFSIKYIRGYKKAGANGVVIAEPAAGLLSPELNSQFSAPYVKQIIEAVQEENFIVVYHNCGNTIPLIDSILSVGAGAYHFGNAINMCAQPGRAARRLFTPGIRKKTYALMISAIATVRYARLSSLKSRTSRLILSRQNPFRSAFCEFYFSESKVNQHLT
jgi:hypothetical protein